jgi:hypothetical protein
MDTYALDFETYYDKRCSIKTLGPMGYFSHPDFDAYMVSIVGDNGVKFVGPPKDFDWSLLQDSVVLSHNASFDESLYLYGVTQGWWPNIQAREWHCTADMAVYCGLPRSLKGATAQAYDLKVDKSTRDNMSGKRWENMKPEFRKEVSDYALKDSELCLKLWQDYSDKWPEREREISLVNRRCVQRGLPIDADLLRKQLETIKAELFNAESLIPWIGDKPLLSRPAFDDHCRSVGIEPPASLAEGDPDAEEWLRVHGQKFAWVGAVKNWRRINSLKCKLESFDYATMPNSRFYGNIMYFGAHTGRFSGSGGNLNLQNLPKDEMFGVKMRHLIAPKEDKRLLVVDLSQIEVRTLCWLAGDHETMKEIKESEDIYEAFAIRFGLWSREKGSLRNDPQTRHKVKAMVLGCGYGAGAPKFAMMSGMSQKDAKEAVDLYRSKMNSVKKLWSYYTSSIIGSFDIKTNFTVDLPSGRVLDYGKLSTKKQEDKIHYVAMMPKNGKRVPVKLWGGLVAENASQALARDIFGDMLRRINNIGNGVDLVMHVHDEVVIEVDADKAEQALEEVIKIMSTPPDWIPDIPLSAEGKILTKYEK